MLLSVTETLRELVAIPSVNPMGKAVTGDIYFESRVTDYLQDLFARLELPCVRQTVEPQRENILARLDATGGTDAPTMLWEVHQDTVPVDGMTIDPFRPQSSDDRICGRGSCDVKGGMSAMLAALSRLRHEPQRPINIVLACTINEEHGFSGAKELVKAWDSNSSANAGIRKIIPHRPQAAIIAEPTEMNVVVAHKGAIRWRLRTTGKACHSSNPEKGLNAIYLVAPVLKAIETHHNALTTAGLDHTLCGRPTVSVGVISGGVSVNTVPDECVIEIDRRLTPGEEPEQARQELIDSIANSVRSSDSQVDLQRHIQHDEPHLCGLPLDSGQNQELAAFVAERAAAVRGESQQVGVAYGTDASVIAASGVPSVVFGPGSIAQAHTCDEWISVDQLNDAVEALVRIGTSELPRV